MILTIDQNVSQYERLHPRFAQAFAALAELAAKPFEPGRHAVDGDTIYINALQYDTHAREDALMEAHRTYIDIMWMVSGEEEIDVCPVEAMTEITQPYDQSGDAVLSKLPSSCSTLKMKPGSVCVLLPEDGHAPGLDAAERGNVQKLIAKVKIL